MRHFENSQTILQRSLESTTRVIERNQSTWQAIVGIEISQKKSIQNLTTEKQNLKYCRSSIFWMKFTCHVLFRFEQKI